MMISENGNDATMEMASHTHAIVPRAVGGDFVMESAVNIGRDTFAVIEGKIHRFWGLFWREGEGEEMVSIGCHTINCSLHEHWEPVIRHWGL